PGGLGTLEEDQKHVARTIAVKDRLSCQVALERVAVLDSGNLDLERLSQVREALLFGLVPGRFVSLREGSLLFGSHKWPFLSRCCDHVLKWHSRRDIAGAYDGTTDDASQ